MKFSDVSAPVFARDAVELDLGDKTITVDVRVLTPAEEADVLEKALAFARARGLEDPRDSDDLYEYGRQIAVLAAGCVDHDSPADEPRPFFASFEEILESRALSRDAIAYLHARQLAWTERHAIRKLQLSDAEFFALLQSTVGGDSVPFSVLRQGTQYACWRTLAVLHLRSLTSGSKSSDDSPDSPSTSPSKKARNKAPRAPS